MIKSRLELSSSATIDNLNSVFSSLLLELNNCPSISNTTVLESAEPSWLVVTNICQVPSERTRVELISWPEPESNLALTKLLGRPTPEKDAGSEVVITEFVSSRITVNLIASIVMSTERERVDNSLLSVALNLTFSSDQPPILSERVADGL